MYEFGARVRYSEADEEGYLRLVSLVDYFQDCSTFHSADNGCSVDDLLAVGRAWFLCYWDIYVDRLPRHCDEITVGTCVHSLKGILVHRNFWMKYTNDQEGQFLARADSVWFMMDTEKGRPIRPGAEMLRFGACEDLLSLPGSPRHVELPEDMILWGRQEVLRRHLDTNRHMNNAQYIALAEEALSAEKRICPRRVRAEYRKAACLGEKLALFCGVSPGGRVVSIQGEDGEVRANVEIG